MKLTRLAIPAGIALLLLGTAAVLLPRGDDPPVSGMVDVTVPALSEAAREGATIFAGNCAGCHGVYAGGVDGAGPPLIHRIYEPGHHADIAFLMAVRRGVRAHHWPFGNMPAVEGLTDSDVALIVAFVREVQRANGIF